MSRSDILLLISGQKRRDPLDRPNTSHTNMIFDCRYKLADYHEKLRTASG